MSVENSILNAQDRVEYLYGECYDNFGVEINKLRQYLLIGLNGENCYKLLLDASNMLRNCGEAQKEASGGARMLEKINPNEYSGCLSNVMFTTQLLEYYDIYYDAVNFLYTNSEKPFFKRYRYICHEENMGYQDLVEVTLKEFNKNFERFVSFITSQRGASNLYIDYDNCAIRNKDKSLLYDGRLIGSTDIANRLISVRNKLVDFQYQFAFIALEDRRKNVDLKKLIN